MKKLLFVLAAVLAISTHALAQDIPFEPVPKKEIKGLKRVFVDGFTASLKKCLDEELCRPSNYHFDKLVSFDRKPLEGYDVYRVSVDVTDNNDSGNEGNIWFEVDYYLDNDLLIIKDYASTLPVPVSV